MNKMIWSKMIDYEKGEFIQLCLMIIFTFNAIVISILTPPKNNMIENTLILLEKHFPYLFLYSILSLWIQKKYKMRWY